MCDWKLHPFDPNNKENITVYAFKFNYFKIIEVIKKSSQYINPEEKDNDSTLSSYQNALINICFSGINVKILDMQICKYDND